MSAFREAPLYAKVRAKTYKEDTLTALWHSIVSSVEQAEHDVVFCVISQGSVVLF
jgi:hypothetical protein